MLTTVHRRRERVCAPRASPDIWGAFQDRFAIPEIGEFYGSTEGNISFVNHATTLADRGACGRQGWVLRRLFGPRIVKFDVEKEEPIRDKNGERRERSG